MKTILLPISQEDACEAANEDWLEMLGFVKHDMGLLLQRDGGYVFGYEWCLRGASKGNVLNMCIQNGVFTRLECFGLGDCPDGNTYSDLPLYSGASA